MNTSNPTDAATASPQRILVFITHHENPCAECSKDLFHGDFVWLHEGKVFCLDCADLGELEYLPSGDHAITRRATKYSKHVAIVLKFSRSRKRNERQGILAEPAAIRRAEEESLADAPLRELRQQQEARRRDAEDRQYLESFKAAILQHFPSCPDSEAGDIAAHACLKHSGRVGRSAFAKELDPVAVNLAVAAHVRHVHTNYDRLLWEQGYSRETARGEISDKVQDWLEKWRRPKA